MENPSDNEKIEFPEIDGFVLWLVERLAPEISEHQLIALTDRFLKGHLIVVLNEKYVVVAPPVLKRIDWDGLEQEVAKNKKRLDS